jgi:TRAP-type mannitol/chloroaromatic compound transport system permease small subunit
MNTYMYIHIFPAVIGPVFSLDVETADEIMDGVGYKKGTPEGQEVSVCIHMHIFKFMNTYLYTFVNKYITFTCMNTCLYIYTYVYTLIHAYVFKINTHISIYIGYSRCT